MALADPQSVTVNAVAISLPRTGLSLTEGTFRSGDQEVTFEVSHQSGKRNRHLVKVTKSLVVADPLVPAINVPVSFSAHLVIDGPRQGVTALQLKELADALVLWSTSAQLAKVISGES